VEIRNMGVVSKEKKQSMGRNIRLQEKAEKEIGVGSPARQGGGAGGPAN
jgi:hypothetical protein